MTLLSRNILLAYAICLPLGFLAIIVTITFPAMMTGEGLATMALFIVYGWSFLGLIIAFLLAIYLGSVRAHNALINGGSLLKSSFNFSITINLIIWIVFVVIAVFNNEKHLGIILLFPIVAFITCTLGSIFTIGLLICYLFKMKIENEKKYRSASKATLV